MASVKKNLYIYRFNVLRSYSPTPFLLIATKAVQKLGVITTVQCSLSLCGSRIFGVSQTGVSWWVPPSTLAHRFITAVATERALARFELQHCANIRLNFRIFLTGAIPFCSSKYMYFTVQNTTYVYQRIDDISITSELHVSTIKQPSSGQCRTHTRYNISVHSMGSHIVYDMGSHRVLRPKHVALM